MKGRTQADGVLQRVATTTSRSSGQLPARPATPPPLSPLLPPPALCHLRAGNADVATVARPDDDALGTSLDQRRRGQRLHRRLARRARGPDQRARADLRALRPHRLVRRRGGDALVLAGHLGVPPPQRRRARARGAVAAARDVDDLFRCWCVRRELHAGRGRAGPPDAPPPAARTDGGAGCGLGLGTHLDGRGAGARRGDGRGGGGPRRRAGGLARGADRGREEADGTLADDVGEGGGDGGRGRAAGLVVAGEGAQEGRRGLGRCQSSEVRHGVSEKVRPTSKTLGAVLEVVWGLSYPWRAATATTMDAYVCIVRAGEINAWYGSRSQTLEASQLMYEDTVFFVFVFLFWMRNWWTFVCDDGYTNNKQRDVMRNPTLIFILRPSAAPPSAFQVPNLL